MPTIDSDISQTLALVNVARQAFGKDLLTELPDSKPGDSADCLFYRGLADCGVTGVGGRGQISFKDARAAAHVASLWGANHDGATVYAPSQFGRVIGAFDKMELSHYNDVSPRDF